MNKLHNIIYPYVQVDFLILLSQNEQYRTYNFALLLITIIMVISQVKRFNSIIVF